VILNLAVVKRKLTPRGAGIPRMLEKVPEKIFFVKLKMNYHDQK
jgi:hypothetical protein